MQNELIEAELRRLALRKADLKEHIVPEFEHQVELLYARIMQMVKSDPHRLRLEDEYQKLFKELRLRSDELVRIGQEIEHLELEKSLKR